MRLRTLTGVVATGALALTLTACGSSSGSSTGTGSSSAPSTQPTPVAALTNLTGVKTEVVLDAGFLTALKSLGVTPGVVAPATLDGKTGTVAFPITGGNATYYTPGSVSPYVTGSIMHQGSGLSLTAGATKVELTNFVVDPGTSSLTGDVSVNGKVAATGTKLFFLDGSTLQPLDTTSSPGNAVLFGTKVEIDPNAAKLLNATFKTTGVPDYFLVGIARITLKLK